MIPKKLNEEKFKNVRSGTVEEMKLFIELMEYLRDNKEFFTKWHNTKLYELFDVPDFTSEEFWDYSNIQTECFFDEFDGCNFRIRDGRQSFYIKFAFYKDCEYYDNLIADLCDDAALELLEEMSLLKLSQQINEFIEAVSFIERVKSIESFKEYLHDERDELNGE